MKSTLLAAIVFCIAIAPSCFAQQPDPNSPHVKTLEAFGRLLERADIDVDEVAGSLFAEESLEELKEQVVDIRRLVARNDSVGVMLESKTKGQFEFEVGGETVTVRFEMTSDEPVKVKSISVSGGNSVTDNADEVAITWDDLESRMDEAANNGFEGALLVTRDGEIVFQKAWGFANREKDIKNSIDTVFAIGSQPVDFTHVAILKLNDQGELSLDDKISKYFENVPADKKDITIRHLMTGQSGFPDFHGLPGDENQDHSWIDRDEAVKRMLNQELLFEPGSGNEHSHSAWGMLAAIVEIASGQSYPDFTHEHLFEPAGMKDTGFFGDDVPESRIAIGYGELKSSEPNAPPHWGQTSWLVMGSGGQVATLGDILRWERAVKDGKLLSPESTRQFLLQHNGLASDGDMFGFEFVHSYDPDALFLLISNSVDSRQERRTFMNLGRQLNQLASGESGNQERPQSIPSSYTLGIEMGISDEGQVIVRRVIQGSGAEKGGIRPDDQIISANGKPISDEPLAVLGPLLQSSNSISFVVLRGEEEVEVSVTPLPRK